MDVKNLGIEELNLNFNDDQWPFEYTDHDRQIVRAIVFDDLGYFYFVQAQRDDIFGKATIIETSGGGVEKNENHFEAIKRELKEELGVEVDILCKLGVVSDFYNLIHRHNINNYFLCKVTNFGQNHLTVDEAECFHLSTLKLSFEQAINKYNQCSNTKLGKLVAQRETPILLYAQKLIQSGVFK